MQIKFEELDYQQQAVNAVAHLFAGQEINRSEFSLSYSSGELGMRESQLGIGNHLALTDDALYENLVSVQSRNGLIPSTALTSKDFTIEMETGTGKTYVYLRTVFELNNRFGFTKFIIVVPSIAIKEGVLKTLEMTKDHFRNLYSGVPFDYFIYDSSKLGTIRNFATSAAIQIMVMTVGAINKKDVNTIYQSTEKVGGEKPIDLIRATHPIVIVDEPQSVDGGLEGRGREALSAMNPLCTLRYSATHADEHHMIYRLDAVDAYERKLVKQIEVAGLEIEGALNRPYVKFIGATNKRGNVTAQIEVNGNSKRETLTLYGDDDLEALTSRGIYANVRIGDINARRDNQSIEVRLSGSEVFLKVGEAINDIDADELRRHMIRRTIEEHLAKEKRLRKQGIKVLSLFFIDTVANYRAYDSNDSTVKGKYALIFEEEYRRAARKQDYADLFESADLTSEAEAVHEGYFSIDRRQRFTDTAENNESARENAERAYNLIMRDKEKLLSFDSKLKFIFSHSALKEGWDNPNVFQICNFSSQNTERWRRQTIGRGLRIAVDQNGNRVYGFGVNTLTVIANESYESFAENLQKDIEADTKIQFGIVSVSHLAAITTKTETGIEASLGIDAAANLIKYLKTEQLLDADGKVSDTLKTALRDDTFSLPAPFVTNIDAIRTALIRTIRRVEVKNSSDSVIVKPRRAVLESDEFRELWDRIKYRTRYQVHFDNEALLKECIEAIKREAIAIGRPKVIIRKATLLIDRAGIDAAETTNAVSTVTEGQLELPDILTELQEKTHLTRKSLVKILLESNSLDHFKRNPQGFIAMAVQQIIETKKRLIVDGIKYQKLGSEHFYSQELFLNEELKGYLGSMLKDAKRSAFEHVIYQSDVERRFAEGLERNEAVKVYAKLPGWFKIKTPLGNYTPDWAVLIEQDGTERLYFVVETKGSTTEADLRGSERRKIDCGREHFAAVAEGNDQVRFQLANEFSELLA